MSKHTAGKWVVHRGEICYRSTDDDQSYGMLCPVDLSDESNLNLISAAPELLEALKSALEALESYAVVVDGEWGMSRTLDDLTLDGELPIEIIQARAAIAKATGGES